MDMRELKKRHFRRFENYVWWSLAGSNHYPLHTVGSGK